MSRLLLIGPAEPLVGDVARQRAGHKRHQVVGIEAALVETEVLPGFQQKAEADDKGGGAFRSEIPPHEVGWTAAMESPDNDVRPDRAGDVKDVAAPESRTSVALRDKTDHKRHEEYNGPPTGPADAMCGALHSTRRCSPGLYCRYESQTFPNLKATGRPQKISLLKYSCCPLLSAPQAHRPPCSRSGHEGSGSLPYTSTTRCRRWC